MSRMTKIRSPSAMLHTANLANRIEVPVPYRNYLHQIGESKCVFLSIDRRHSETDNASLSLVNYSHRLASSMYSLHRSIPGVSQNAVTSHWDDRSECPLEKNGTFRSAFSILKCVSLLYMFEKTSEETSGMCLAMGPQSEVQQSFD